MSKFKIFSPNIAPLILLLIGSFSFSQEIKIDSLFQEYNEKPGIAVAVYKDGAYIYKEGFGYSNLDYSTKITEETVFELGALTMHVTASCILKLEEDGKLKLQDDIREYLNDLPDYQEGSVTIQHLLNHTSGIMDYLVALDMSGQDWDKPFTSEDAYKSIVKNGKLGIRPGQEYEYSNSNYLLLNKIIEKISGKSLNDYAREHFFEPLGMPSTFYLEDANAIVKNRAIGYSEENEEFTMSHNFNFTSLGDGRLYTSLNDLMIWAENLENNQLPISNFEERLIKRGLLNDGSGMSYALGLEHGFEKGHPFYAHSGYWSGFSSMLLKFPDQNLWVLTLSNNGSLSAPSKAYEIAGFYLDPKVEEPQEIKKYKLSKKILAAYEGDYFGYKNGYLRKINLNNDTLVYTSSPESEYKLQALAKNKFKVLGTPIDYTIEFNTKVAEPIEMTFLREGIKQYSYERYAPLDSDQIDLNKYIGTYHNTMLDITYELKLDNDVIAIYVKGTKLMDYLPVMKNIFSSQSTHHGYLKFNKDISKFTLSDYSFKPIEFEKIRS